MIGRPLMLLETLIARVAVGMGIPIWISILMGYVYRYPYGDSHRNPVGMGMEIPFPHGNPAVSDSTNPIILPFEILVVC